MARILLIDDEQDLLEICAMLLESEGHEVVCLSESSRAEEVARRFLPEVVFLDWVMPERGGRELFPRLHEVLGDSARIVIASALPGMSAEVQRLGAAGLLEKPFSAEELRRWADGKGADLRTPPV